MSVVVLHQHDPTGAIANALRETLTLLAEASKGDEPVWPLQVVSCLPGCFNSDHDRWLVSLGLLRLVADGEMLAELAESSVRAALEARRSAQVADGRVRLIVIPTIDDEWGDGTVDEVRAPVDRAVASLTRDVAADDATARVWSEGIRIVRWVALRRFPDPWPKSLFDWFGFVRSLVIGYSGIDASGPRTNAFFGQRLTCDLLLLIGLARHAKVFASVFPELDSPTLFLPWSIRVESRSHLVVRERLIARLLGGAGEPGLLPRANGDGSRTIPEGFDSLQDLKTQLSQMSNSAGVDSKPFEWPDGPLRPEPRDLFARIDTIGPVGRDEQNERSWPVWSYIRWPFHMPERRLARLSAEVERGLAAAVPQIRRHVLETLEENSRARRQQIERATSNALRSVMLPTQSAQDVAQALRECSPLFVNCCDAVIGLLQGSVTVPDSEEAPNTSIDTGSLPSDEENLLAQRRNVPSSAGAWMEAIALSSLGIFGAAVLSWTGIGLLAGLAWAILAPLVSLLLRNRQANRYLGDWDDARKAWKNQVLGRLRTKVTTSIGEERVRGETSLRVIAAAVKQAQRRWLIELRGLSAHLALAQSITAGRLVRARDQVQGTDGVWSLAEHKVPMASSDEIVRVLLSQFSLLTELRGLPAASRTSHYDAAISREVLRAVEGITNGGVDVDTAALGEALRTIEDPARLSTLSSTAPLAAGELLRGPERIKKVVIHGSLVGEATRNASSQMGELDVLESNEIPADLIVAAQIQVCQRPEMADHPHSNVQPGDMHSLRAGEGMTSREEPDA